MEHFSHWPSQPIADCLLIHHLAYIQCTQKSVLCEVLRTGDDLLGYEHFGETSHNVVREKLIGLGLKLRGE